MLKKPPGLEKVVLKHDTVGTIYVGDSDHFREGNDDQAVARRIVVQKRKHVDPALKSKWCVFHAFAYSLKCKLVLCGKK